MQSKVKMLVAAMAVVALFLITTVKAEAAWKGWTEYFTQDESKAIKKMVDAYIRDSIEDEDKRWKDLISGSLIKDGDIDADKVDSSIAKRKVYTGTFPASTTVANGTHCSASDVDECDYFVKISVPEVNITSTDITDVNVYTKSIYTGLGANVWSEDTYNMEDGYVWFDYAGMDDGVLDWDNFGEEYKIVVNY